MLQKLPLTGLLVLLALAGCARKPQPTLRSAASTAIPVETATAESRHIDQSISVSGSLLADESVAISSESAGRIKGIYVDFGQPVRKGQIVAQLEDAQYRFQQERTETALRQAQARLGLGPNSTSGVKSSDQTPAMRQAQAQMEDTPASNSATPKSSSSPATSPKSTSKSSKKPSGPAKQPTKTPATPCSPNSPTSTPSKLISTSPASA